MTYFNSIIEFFQDLKDQWADADRDLKVAKIVRVFTREKGLVDELLVSEQRVCNHPGRCAIGALLVAAGVPGRVLLDRWSVSLNQFDLLLAEYGLTDVQVEKVICVNDGLFSYTEDGVEVVEGVSYSQVCSALPIEEARVCEVSAYVRTLALA